MGKKTVRWIKPEDLDERMSSSRNILAKDRFDQPVFLFENDLPSAGLRPSIQTLSWKKRWDKESFQNRTITIEIKTEAYPFSLIKEKWWDY